MRWGLYMVGIAGGMRGRGRRGCELGGGGGAGRVRDMMGKKGEGGPWDVFLSHLHTATGKILKTALRDQFKTYCSTAAV